LSNVRWNSSVNTGTLTLGLGCVIVQFEMDQFS